MNHHIFESTYQAKETRLGPIGEISGAVPYQSTWRVELIFPVRFWVFDVAAVDMLSTDDHFANFPSGYLVGSHFSLV